jgi:hypothetical protein
MDTPSTEQDVRREAIRRRLTGEPRCDICRDLNHSPRWFSNWWAVYQQNPRTDFDRSRVPFTSPSEIPESVVHAIVSIRKTLEAAATPATRYGLIARALIRVNSKTWTLTRLVSRRFNASCKPRVSRIQLAPVMIRRTIPGLRRGSSMRFMRRTSSRGTFVVAKRSRTFTRSIITVTPHI